MSPEYCGNYFIKEQYNYFSDFLLFINFLLLLLSYL